MDAYGVESQVLGPEVRLDHMFLRYAELRPLVTGDDLVSVTGSHSGCDPERYGCAGLDAGELLHLGDGVEVDEDARLGDLLELLLADEDPGVHDLLRGETCLEAGPDLPDGDGVDPGALLLQDPEHR